MEKPTTQTERQLELPAKFAAQLAPAATPKPAAWHETTAALAEYNATQRPTNDEPISEKPMVDLNSTIRLVGSWCRKDGRAHYGSEGGSCSIEVDVPAELWFDQAKRAELMRDARAAMQLCKRAVDEELAIAGAAARAAAERETAEAAQRNADRRAAADPARRVDDYGDLADAEPEVTEHRRREPEPRPAPRMRSEYDDARDTQRQPERRYDERRDEPPARRDERPAQRGSGGGQRSGGNQSWLDVDRVPDRASQLYGYARDLDAMGWFKSWGKRNQLASKFNEWPSEAVRDAVDDFVRAGRPQDPAQRSDERQPSNGYAGAGRRS